MNIEKVVIDTKVGRLKLEIEGYFLSRVELNSSESVTELKSELSHKVSEQINHYLIDARYRFDLPLKQSGTEHQMKVWKALSNIPSGEVLTYGQLAKKIGSSARAIGNACRRNPLPIIVPCHRIVAASDIGGFSGTKKGRLLGIKRELLSHEGHDY